jgi:hypothetical protein
LRLVCLELSSLRRKLCASTAPDVSGCLCAFNPALVSRGLSRAKLNAASVGKRRSTPNACKSSKRRAPAGECVVGRVSLARRPPPHTVAVPSRTVLQPSVTLDLRPKQAAKRFALQSCDTSVQLLLGCAHSLFYLPVPRYCSQQASHCMNGADDKPVAKIVWYTAQSQPNSSGSLTAIQPNANSANANSNATRGLQSCPQANAAKAAHPHLPSHDTHPPTHPPTHTGTQPVTHRPCPTVPHRPRRT